MASREKGVVVYKIVDIDGDVIKTLFHGNNGSRVLRKGQWLRAVERTVRDGVSTPYRSGWHVMPSLEACLQYLGKFKNIAPKAVVRCRAQGLRDKAHSTSPVLLARFLFIEDVVWKAQGELVNA